jgi:hypothetical protein
VNAVRDYHTESEQLSVMHALHASTATNSAEAAEHAAHEGHAGHAAGGAGCDSLCQSKRSTLDVQKRAVFYGGILLLISNAVLVAFLVVLWGIRLWTRYTPPRPVPSGAV